MKNRTRNQQRARRRELYMLAAVIGLFVLSFVGGMATAVAFQASAW